VHVAPPASFPMGGMFAWFKAYDEQFDAYTDGQKFGNVGAAEDPWFDRSGQGNNVITANYYNYPKDNIFNIFKTEYA